MLRAAAKCLRGTVTADDVVGRFGGDEFVVQICRDISRDELDDMIDRLRTALATPVEVGGTSASIHASIGVVEVDPDDDRSAVTIWLPRSPERRHQLAQALEEMASLVRSAPDETGLD